MCVGQELAAGLVDSTNLTYCKIFFLFYLFHVQRCTIGQVTFTLPFVYFVFMPLKSNLELVSKVRLFVHIQYRL